MFYVTWNLFVQHSYKSKILMRSSCEESFILLTFTVIKVLILRGVAVMWNRKSLQRPNSWTKSIQMFSEFSFLLFTVTSTAFPWDLYFFKHTQPLTYFCSKVTVHCKGEEKGGKPDRKPYHLPNSLRNQYRNLKSENSQDNAQKLQRNCTFMNSASTVALVKVSEKSHICW